jgi:hypothetical protein
MFSIDFNGNTYDIEPCICGSMAVEHDAGMMACQIRCLNCGRRVVHNGFHECLESWNKKTRGGVSTHGMPVDPEVRKLCDGCSEDFYNGKNPYGIEECWNLRTAKVVQKRFVPIDAVPPWGGYPVRWTLTCHRRTGYVGVPPSCIR